MVEKKVKICDECGERVATHQCKFCKKDLCNIHFYKLGIYTAGRRSSGDVKVSSRLVISVEKDGDDDIDSFDYVCGDCKRRIEKVLTILSKKDLTFMLDKLWDYILELAKLEAL